MDPSPNTNNQHPTKELLDAQTHLANHIYSFHKSMALKCAIQLGIPDAIQKHGKPITLTDLCNALSLHPNRAYPLFRLMRLLVHSNFFSEHKLPNTNNETQTAYGLTINSELLLKDHPFSQHSYVLSILDPVMTDPAHHYGAWFRHDDQQSSLSSPFYVAHGRTLWQHASQFPDYNAQFNHAIASDARLVGQLLASNEEFEGLFEGIESMVDVGGGDGSLARELAQGYTELKCIVFDLPHVVRGLNGNGKNLEYVAGDMFVDIPSADAVLLKKVLHAWSDEDCIKILGKCKEALQSKGKGISKVIIIEMVIGSENDNPMHYSTQLLLDMQMLSITNGGKQRTEEEWKRLFINAGFKDYKIYSSLGTRSIIEVYPNYL